MGYATYFFPNPRFVNLISERRTKFVKLPLKFLAQEVCVTKWPCSILSPQEGSLNGAWGDMGTQSD